MDILGMTVHTMVVEKAGHRVKVTLRRSRDGQDSWYEAVPVVKPCTNTDPMKAALAVFIQFK